MNKHQIETYLKLTSEGRNPSFLIRDILLNNMFGNDTEKVLYYFGKDLADNFTFNSISNIMTVFKNLGFGEISLSKVKKNIYLFQIEGNEVSQRLKLDKKPEFALETGFLAKSISQTIKRPAEGQFTVDEKKSIVLIMIQTIAK